jgi:hypothetical protein
MRVENINFIKLINKTKTNIISEDLTNLGYQINTSEEFQKYNISKYQYNQIYINEDIKQILVIVSGFDGIDFFESSNILEKIFLINTLKNTLDSCSNFIQNIIDKYTNYNITFIGSSIGGLAINLKLNNTNYKAYTYNAFLVNFKASENITNYVNSADILSIGLFDKDPKFININLLDFFIKEQFNLISILTNLHQTTIYKYFEINCINTDIPLLVNE